MPVRDPQAVLQKLGQTILKVDTYFLQRTGFVANQTVLKLGEYNLQCVPATIGLAESRLLAVLSAAEVSHFTKFKGGTQILLLAFDDPDNKDIARFPLRVSLVDILPIPDRKNVCFLVVRAKSLPAEFILFLGDFLEALEGRKEAWEAGAGELIPVSGLGPTWDGTATFVGGEREQVVKVLAFHTKTLQIQWPGDPPTGEASVHLKLRPRNRPLVLEGRLDVERAFCPDFQPDWLAFVEDVAFQKTLRARSSPRKSP